MIKITVENVEGMEPGALHRIAGLFTVIANYAGGIATEEGPVRELPKTGGDRFADHIAKDYARHEAKPFNPFAGDVAHDREDAAPSLIELDPTHTAGAGQWPAFGQMTPVEPTQSGIDVDSKGSPWDGRIHASTRAKVADGTWRMKRGADDSLVASVQAEIAQTMAIPAVPKPPSVSNVGIPALPPATTTVTASAGAATTASPSNFLSLMKGITAGFADKSITQENINMACSSVGVPSLPMLSQRPDLIGKVAMVLGVVMA